MFCKKQQKNLVFEMTVFLCMDSTAATVNDIRTLIFNMHSNVDTCVL